jgi:hypothetical protein
LLRRENSAVDAAEGPTEKKDDSGLVVGLVCFLGAIIIAGGGAWWWHSFKRKENGVLTEKV